MFFASNVVTLAAYHPRGSVFSLLVSSCNLSKSRFRVQAKLWKWKVDNKLQACHLSKNFKNSLIIHENYFANKLIKWFVFEAVQNTHGTCFIRSIKLSAIALCFKPDKTLPLLVF